MKLLEPIETLLHDGDGTGDGVSLHECRDCGTNLPTPADECSCCGSTEIAHYEW